MPDRKSRIFEKNWTGEEVGRAVIDHLIDEYRAAFDPGYRPALQVEQLEQLKSGLYRESDRRAYNQYITLYDGILDLVTTCQSMLQQFYHGFYRALNVVQGLSFAAFLADRLDMEPQIVTRQQYLQAQRDARQADAGKMESPASLFFHTVSYYAAAVALEPSPRVPKAVLRACEPMRGELFENTELFSAIAKIAQNGFFMGEDGPQPDFNDSKRYYQYWESIYRQRCAGKSMAEVRDSRWVDDYAIPAGTTRFDVLFGPYREAAMQYFGDREGQAEKYRVFVREFPQLSQAIVEALCKHAFCAPFFAPGRPLAEEVASREQLARHKIPGFSLRPQPDLSALCTGRYAQSRDIAVLVDTPESRRNIGPDGQYHGSYPAGPGSFQSFLSQVNDDAKACLDALIIPSLRSLYACAALLDSIGSIYQFHGMGILRPHLSPLEEKVRYLNELIVLLYHQLRDNEEAESRMTTYLHLTDIEPLLPSAAALEDAKKQLSDLPGLNKAVFSDLLHQMQNAPGGEG